MGLCNAPSGKVNKENVNQDITICGQFVRNHSIITTRDCDEWRDAFDAEGNPVPFNPAIGERVVQRPKEFWCIDARTGAHVNGYWVRNCHRFLPDEFLYYRVHDDRVTQPLFVYDEVADQWAECIEDFNEHTPEHRKLLHPGKETIKLSHEDMIKVANAGFAELMAGKA